MTFSPGSRLGPYEIVGLLGAGGMGEVYRGRDTRLNRDVAIKILPPSVAENPQRRARFEREARVLSCLSHPNLCALYDIGNEQGIAFLVMECVEGESIEQRVRLGPLAWGTAVRWAIQIAGALDAAHHSGVVHRDLKPANVMVTGQHIKVLDFGLAKLVGDQEEAGAKVNEETKSLTAERRVVGTPHYMAPEQIEGRTVDARVDVFALGTVLYEMLTGFKAFDGSSPASATAAILTAEPAALPATGKDGSALPRALDHLVRRALAKDPDERWQTACDVMHELQWILDEGSRQITVTPASVVGRRRLMKTAAAVALTAIGAVGGWMAQSPQPAFPDRPATVLTIDAPEGTRLSSGNGVLAVSPNGRMIAFLAGPAGGPLSVWVRRLDSPIAQVIAGTEGANSPFWSPDSGSIGFYADRNRRLERVDVGGGRPTVVAELPSNGWLNNTPSAFWASDDTMVFSEAGALYRIRAAGGEKALLISEPDKARGERAHAMPSPLPDGRFFYVVAKYDTEHTELRLHGLRPGQDVSLPAIGSNATFAAGYLLFRRGDSLVAQPFDSSARTLGGRPVLLSENVAYNPGNARTVFAVSPDVLVYRLEAPRKLTWRDRTGRPTGSIGVEGRDWNPAIAPDGSQRVAVDRFDPSAGEFGIWTIDDRDGAAPLTHAVTARFAVWSRDGRWIAYKKWGSNTEELRRTLASGIGGDEMLYGGDDVIPLDWSADGRYIVYASAGDLWAWPLVGENRAPSRITATSAIETTAHLSPDGRWIAYSATEGGQGDVWVQSFPGGAGKRRISVAGGIDPTWRADGREIFFLAPDGNLMAAPVSAGAALAIGTPTVLFHTDPRALSVSVHAYTPSPDGQRFLVNAPVDTPDRITVVLHWVSLVRQ